MRRPKDPGRASPLEGAAVPFKGKYLIGRTTTHGVKDLQWVQATSRAHAAAKVMGTHGRKVLWRPPTL
jgi:hypothetical protein